MQPRCQGTFDPFLAFLGSFAPESKKCAVTELTKRPVTGWQNTKMAVKMRASSKFSVGPFLASVTSDNVALTKVSGWELLRTFGHIQASKQFPGHIAQCLVATRVLVTRLTGLVDQ